MMGFWKSLVEKVTKAGPGDGDVVFGYDATTQEFAGFDPRYTQVVPTASLPAAAAAQNGKVIIEDAGTGDRNLIIYAGGQRFRIDGGSNV